MPARPRIDRALRRRREDRDYWDRRINIKHRKINRKKYYGVGVEMDAYVDTAVDALDIEDALNILQARETRRTEDLADDVAQMVIIKQLDGEMRNMVAGVLADSFQKGTRRLFTKDGQRVDVEEFVNQGAVSELVQDQDDYWQNMQQDLKDKVRNAVRSGFEEGESIPKIRDRVEKTSKEFTKDRAETIARSEVIKASSQGTQHTMEKAGVDEFMWLSARNSDVCKGEEEGEPPSFETNIDGERFTSCRELDGTTWDRTLHHPVPVKHSHPNCRCTLVANIDSDDLEL